MCSEALRSLCISSGLEAVDLIRKALESGEWFPSVCLSRESNSNFSILPFHSIWINSRQGSSDSRWNHWVPAV
jgi:hypothetical protein